MSRSNPLTQFLEQGVREGVFPGAVLLVRHCGQEVVHEAVGKMGNPPYDQAAHVHTIYDLASLTKPLATATAMVMLIQDSQIALDQAAREWLPEWEGSPYEHTTIRQLLRHSAGLPAWRPYYQTLSPQGCPPNEEEERQDRIISVMRMIAAEPVEYEPDSRSVYSDLGFMALGVVIERCGNTSLAEFCRTRVFDQVNLHPLFFIDAEGNPTGGDGDLTEIAPTEQDPWRGRLIHADVHDENAYALGGIAGHAGLFGTALSVSGLSNDWLQAVLGRSSLLPSTLARQFVRRQDHAGTSSWALGWDTPTTPSSSGRFFSPDSFGHLGYAGTSLWIDPVREVEVILLTNRVHPTRENRLITTFRPALHDLIMMELGFSN